MTVDTLSWLQHDHPHVCCVRLLPSSISPHYVERDLRCTPPCQQKRKAGEEGRKFKEATLHTYSLLKGERYTRSFKRKPALP